MERFVDKIAVVTGAAYGLGDAISKELLRKGLIVVGIDRDINKLQELATEILANKNEFTGKFHGIQCNIRNEKEIENTFRKINDCIGPIWILVNNAGTSTESQLAEIETDDFDKIFQTNVKGLLLCTKEALRSMNTNKVDGGHIINVNSVTSLTKFDSLFGCTPYPASKLASRALSEGLRREITKRKQNVKISDISPGLVDTKLARIITCTLDAKTQVLTPQDVANACLVILNTSPNVLISELTIRPIHYHH